MSGFKRSNNGLSNQHLFHNVDVVMFLEGGSRSFNKEEAYAGNHTYETEDTIFWGKIFSKFSHGLKIKFKSIGSKVTIKEIAFDIINGNVRSVLVAMDNEFDEVLNRRVNHPNIFYTHGYSWENDVWSVEVVKKVIEDITAVTINNNDIDKNFEQFIKKIKIAVFADSYLFSKGSSFFPRQSGHLFCVDCRPTYLPYIKANDINLKLTLKSLNKNTLYKFGKKNSIEPLKYCYGHLLADYCCQLILNYIKHKHSLTNLSKDIIYRMGMTKYFDMYFNLNTGIIYDYYERQFKANGII